MTASGIAQVLVVGAALAVTCPFLGRWMAGVLGRAPGEPASGDRWFLPIERPIYLLIGVGTDVSMRWQTYAKAAVSFGAVNTVVLYAILRLQGVLPLNPTGASGQSSALAFNTSVSFVTGTNWQAYAGETGASHLAQMAGLVTAHLTAAAVGLAVGAALLRSLTNKKPSPTIGNFWVDVMRSITRILIPLALVLALVLVGLGAVENLDGFQTVTTLEGSSQALPAGPAASQEITKALGTNGGGLYNTGSAHPLAVPNGVAALLELYLSLLIPLAFPFAFGRMAKGIGRRHESRVILAVMVTLLCLFTFGSMVAELSGNSRLPDAVDQAASAASPGGNLEGKEVRFGPEGSALTTVGTMGTTAGLTTMSLEGATPAGSGMALGSILLGEVSPGGVGTGMVGMVLNVLLAVFIAGLMVGRTPEYLGKKLEAAEIKLMMLAILVVPLTVLIGTAAAVLVPAATEAAPNPGPHGFTEIFYAYASTTNGNGSAMAGLGSNTDWYNTTLGLVMLIGRYAVIVPVLALSGLLAQKRRAPKTVGTMPTNTGTFYVLLLGVVLIVAGLTFFAALGLGPIVESLSG